MRGEGGWVRTYRAHHDADTMTTAGHMAKAMRDIDDEVDKNDWVTAVIDVPGVGGGVVDRLIELPPARDSLQRWCGGHRQGAVPQ
jgi:hypothetical protein